MQTSAEYAKARDAQTQTRVDEKACVEDVGTKADDKIDVVRYALNSWMVTRTEPRTWQRRLRSRGKSMRSKSRDVSAAMPATPSGAKSLWTQATRYRSHPSA